jgi:hypothetical protein
MLGTRKRKGRRIDERKKKALKDLNNRRKKGNRAVGGAKVKWLARLGNGNNVGGFPDSREVSGVDGKVEDLSKIRDATGAKMLQMKGCQTIGTSGRGVAG